MICDEMPLDQDMMQIARLLNNLKKPVGFNLYKDDNHDGDFDWDYENFFDPWNKDKLMDEIDGRPKNF